MQGNAAESNQDERTYGTSAIAATVGVSLMTIHRAIRDGHLEAYRTKPNAGHFRVRESARDAYFALIGFTRGATSTPDSPPAA